MTEYSTEILPCGNNAQEHSSFFDSIRKNKNLKKAVASFCLLGSMVGAGGEYSHAATTTSDGSYIDVMSDQDLEEIKARQFNLDFRERVTITNMDRDEGVISRGYRDPRFPGTIHAEEAIAAYHDINFINPHTDQPDTMKVLIEEGHDPERLEFLKTVLSRGASNKLAYEIMMDRSAKHGEFVYTTLASRDDEESLGYVKTPIGILQIDYTPNNIDKGVGIFFHELNHYDATEVYSSQLEEAGARVMTFMSMAEENKKTPGTHDLRAENKHMYDFYQKYKDADMPNDVMIQSLYLIDAHTSTSVPYYFKHAVQFDMIESDLVEIGNMPESLRQEGRPDNYLENVDAESLLNLSIAHIDNTDFKKFHKALAEGKDYTTEIQSEPFSLVDFHTNETVRGVNEIEIRTPLRPANVTIYNADGKSLVLDMNDLRNEETPTFSEEFERFIGLDENAIIGFSNFEKEETPAKGNGRETTTFDTSLLLEEENTSEENASDNDKTQSNKTTIPVSVLKKMQGSTH